jgi:biopolymer transport protein ExbD
MARYRPSNLRQQKAQTAPQEPNLVPIMNLFLTIIPFMLMLVVISQVALVALNFSQGEGGGGSSGGGGGGKDIEKVEIIIVDDQYARKNNFLGFEIREPGMDAKLISAISQNYDFVALDKQIKSIRDRKADLIDITVTVYPNVLYGDLIKTIDLCKANGFTQVHYNRPTASYY